MNRQAILDVLNSLEVIDSQGGEEAYILVASSPENMEELAAVGVTAETAGQYGEDEDFCILALAFGEGYADTIKNGKLALWGPIDDDLRYRVTEGEGTAEDAIRLLHALEPNLYGKATQ